MGYPPPPLPGGGGKLYRTDAPYKKDSLTSLDTTTRPKVIAWLLANGEDWNSIAEYCGTSIILSPGSKGLIQNGGYDAKLIALYNSVMAGSPYVGSASGNTSVIQQNPASLAIGGLTDWFSQLKAATPRIAEFAVGIILLAIGLNHALKDGTGVDAGAGVKKVAKVAMK